MLEFLHYISTRQYDVNYHFERRLIVEHAFYVVDDLTDVVVRYFRAPASTDT